MDTTAVRLIAGGEGRTRVFYRRALVLVSVLSVLVTALVVGAARFVCVTLFDDEELTAPLRIMALGIGPWALAVIHASLLQGAGKIGLSIFVRFVLFFLVAIPFLLLFARGGSLEGAAAAHVAATVSIFAFAVVLWRRTVSEGFTLSNRDLPPSRWREVVNAGLSLCSIGLLSTASALADTFLLGALGTMEEVGTFRVALRLAALSSAALEAVRAAIAPRLANYHSGRDWQMLEYASRAGATLAVGLTVPYWLIVLIFPRQVLGLFGPEFTVAVSATVLLVIGRIADTVAGPSSTVLTMAGLERPLRNLMVVITALRILLLSLAIPLWGIVGAAAVGCFSDIAAGMARVALVRHKTGIMVLPLPRRLLPYHVDGLPSS
jgi:O-antigen/teichoic acid export membrane protein